MTTDKDKKNPKPEYFAFVDDMEETATAEPVEGDTNDADTEKDFSDIYRRPPFDVHDAAAKEFGTIAADFAKHLAEEDFPKFKAGMRDIGFPTLSDDEPEGIRGRRLSMYSNKMPRLANAALCMRYPFLVPRSRWSGKVIWYDEIDGALWDETRGDVGGRTDAFGTTELDALPLGWLVRFGLEICEDVKTILESSAEIKEPMECYHIEQIKEKFATLRWYSAGTPRDVYEDEQRLIDLYESISARTCIGCGGHDRVRGTGGWLSYQCVHCREDSRYGQLGVPLEDIHKRYNELAESGRLVELVKAQSDAWKENAGFGQEILDSLCPVDNGWKVPWHIRPIVTKDILDEDSWGIGTMEDARIHTTYEFKPGMDDPIRHETDLFEWGERLGLLGVRLARAVDRMRHDFDGDTNAPIERDSEEV